MAGGGGESTITLEYTPTWIVTVVCTVIVFISLLFERVLHWLGKTLKRRNQKPLFDALQKIKEELMLLGFISLLLVVFQGTIQRICVRESLMHHLRPCKKDDTATAAAHFSVGFSGGARRLLAGGGADSTHCQREHSFFKQFYGSVTETDYTTMRRGFIMTHCKGNKKFNFYQYMIRVLEADFKKVVGISWQLWIFVMIFLLLNVEGWHAYFWISFIPLVLLLAIGTKLEHIITQLAQEVAEKHSAIEGDLVVTPSDHLFWFHRPQIVIFLIHFILFQNAFEIAYFFWILTTYSFNSCIMGQVGFIVPRLVISVLSQLLCSYSTLPLYAIVTQMGSFFNKAIFDANVQAGILDWARGAKKNKKTRIVNGENASRNESAEGILLHNIVVENEPAVGGRKAEITQANRSINRRRPGGNEDLEAPVGVHLHASQSCDFRLVVEIMVSKSKAKSKLSDFINRYDKVNYPHGIDEEKSHEFYPRKFSLAEHGEVGGNCVANDNTHPKLIPLDGCSASEAVTFLTERWAAAVHLLDNSSADVSVKPSAYLGADDELSGRIGMQRYTKPTAM
ncbi:hypothetical protein MUK42_05743 [Musa troglodytarum]|uniref:MLO-like protein n=1 Tax=Musa troglodytarum TaxID=320322 RepID=A0A9E7HAQ9_9LILI|nr:hypothetical protein MUK42_05743 [Musa troglodytarum]